MPCMHLLVLVIMLKIFKYRYVTIYEHMIRQSKSIMMVPIIRTIQDIIVK